MELRIDPEFRDKIPPLTQEEFDQLRDNILEDGEIYEPIAAWNGVIVDGHNRWKIYLEHPELPEPKIAEKQFADKYEAFEWMYRKQLGRRNLTEAQRAYMIGKMYEARKKSVGQHKGNQYTKLESGQNVQIPTRREIKDGTAGQIGRDFGINGKTVRRYANYAESVDAIREDSPDAAQKILSGEPGVPAATVTRYTSLPPDEKEQFVADVIAGNRPKAVSGNPAGFNQEMRKLHAEMLRGMTEFYSKYRGQFKQKELVKSLSRVTPQTLMRDGHGMPGGAGKVYGRIILRYYNYNRTKRLEDII